MPSLVLDSNREPTGGWRARCLHGETRYTNRLEGTVIDWLAGMFNRIRSRERIYGVAAERVIGGLLW